MTKYIKSYGQIINESINRGAVVLIKGKAEGSKKKLYATHVLGSTPLQKGAIMLFLSEEFYRVKEEDGQLKAVKISYRSDEDLKSALSFKSPGKISVVKNNKKTPWHWKTLRHTSIQEALKEVEQEIIEAKYLLESEELYDPWKSFYDYLVPKILDTVFFGRDEIMTVGLDPTQVIKASEKEYENMIGSDENPEYIEAAFDFKVIDNSEEIGYHLEKLNLKEPLDVSLFIRINLEYDYNPGERETYDYPGYPAGYELTSSSVELEDVYIEGSEADRTPIVSKAIKEVNELINKMDEKQLELLVHKNIRPIFPLE